MYLIDFVIAQGSLLMEISPLYTRLAKLILNWMPSEGPLLNAGNNWIEATQNTFIFWWVK